MPRKRRGREQPRPMVSAGPAARRDRVAALQEVAAALASALTMEEVARIVFDNGLARCGARAMGIVWSFAPGELRLAFGRGVTAAEFEALDAASRLGAPMPVREALRARAPVWVDSPEQLRTRYPALEPLRAKRGEHGFAVVPLVVGDGCPGVIGLTFGPEHVPTPAERRFVEALAQLGAQAFDRARLFEAEQAARREAEEVGRLQEQLMAVVGHDLRTPLSAISLAAATLARRGGLAPEAAALVERITSSAARMGALIGDLVDLSRARQGVGVSLHVARIDLGEVVRGALAELDATPDGQNVSFELSGDAALDADRDRLAQVVSNLVANALQHGAGAPVSVRVTGGDTHVTLAVANAGPPIPPELLPHVFEPFRRGEAYARGAGGPSGNSGLGLFIVSEIVRAHGGTVDARSGREGTVFTVRLPRARPLG
jgi:phosphoserine phosphatase RsbU/P